MTASTHPDDAVAVLVSGGVDSAVLVVDLRATYAAVHPIYVRFGLRWEAAELEHLRDFLEAEGGPRAGLLPLTVLDEPVSQVYGDHWSNAGRPGVPDDRTDDGAVYLPGRNILLAAKAAVFCRLRGIESLAFGILRGNPFPDSTPAFFGRLTEALNLGMDGRLRIVRPYETLAKPDIIRKGAGLPLHLTFSCLDPQSGRHCGRCNKCAERARAFRDAGLTDLTPYAARPELF